VDGVLGVCHVENSNSRELCVALEITFYQMGSTNVT
jgi:hypothetical protein